MQLRHLADARVLADSRAGDLRIWLCLQATAGQLLSRPPSHAGMRGAPSLIKGPHVSWLNEMMNRCFCQQSVFWTQISRQIDSGRLHGLRLTHWLSNAGVQGAADLDALAAQLDEAQAQLEGGNAALLLRASFLIELLMSDCRTPGHSQVIPLPKLDPISIWTFHMNLYGAAVWLRVYPSDCEGHTGLL